MSTTPVVAKERQSLSCADPAGAVYDDGDRMLRGIRHPFDEFYSGLLANGSIQNLLGKKIIETSVAAEGLDGYPLTVQHRKIAPVSYCYEWPPDMLRDAALLTLDLCIELADQTLVLQDGSPWNVVFEGPRPIFVDFTSIVPQDAHLPWVAYDQFCRLFLYPLVLGHAGLGWVVRALLLDPVDGVSDGEFVRLMPARSLLAMPWLFGRVHLPRVLLRVLRRMKADSKLPAMSAKFRPDERARLAFFRSLKKHVTGIPLHPGKSRWSSYGADLEPFLRLSGLDRKQQTVAEMIDRCRPTTVADVGCNRGGYAIMAAQAGSRVSAFDTDEDSIAHLYDLAKRKQLQILPLVIDVVNPSPSCGWRAREYAPAPTRLRSQMAIALALVHHLAITQRQTFERIVPTLADYADRWLVTEFVPIDDPRSKELMVSNRRDMSWYSLDGFLAELRRVFSSVETFPSHPDTRTLVLCTR